MKVILDLINKQFGKDFAIEDYVEIKLYNSGSPFSFESRLSDVVRIIQKLLVLHKFLKISFFVGVSDYYFEIMEEEFSDKIEVGPSIREGSFSGESLFEYYLDRIAISTLIISNAFSREGGSWISEQGKVENPGREWNEVTEDLTFVSDKLIISGSSLFVKSGLQEEIDSLLSERAAFCKAFVKEHKDKATVSHILYIDWLVSWFPGMIHLRSLE